MVYMMTSKQRSAFKRKLRKRLEKVTDLAQTHCGHDGEVEKFFRASDDFVEWVVKEIEAVGVEAACPT